MRNHHYWQQRLCHWRQPLPHFAYEQNWIGKPLPWQHRPRDPTPHLIPATKSCIAAKFTSLTLCFTYKVLFVGFDCKLGLSSAAYLVGCIKDANPSWICQQPWPCCFQEVVDSSVIDCFRTGSTDFRSIELDALCKAIKLKGCASKLRGPAKQWLQCKQTGYSI